jgi:hypothetical protein
MQSTEVSEVLSITLFVAAKQANQSRQITDSCLDWGIAFFCVQTNLVSTTSLLLTVVAIYSVNKVSSSVVSALSNHGRRRF